MLLSLQLALFRVNVTTSCGRWDAVAFSLDAYAVVVEPLVSSTSLSSHPWFRRWRGDESGKRTVTVHCMTAMSVMPVVAVEVAAAVKSPPGVVHSVEPLVEFQVTPASVHTFDTLCTPSVRLVGGGLVMVSLSTALLTTPQLGTALRSNWRRARCLTVDPVRTCRTLSFSWLAFGEPSAIQES
jgi:hypothetical protein